MAGEDRERLREKRRAAERQLEEVRREEREAARASQPVWARVLAGTLIFVAATVGCIAACWPEPPTEEELRAQAEREAQNGRDAARMRAWFTARNAIRRQLDFPGAAEFPDVGLGLLSDLTYEEVVEPNPRTGDWVVTSWVKAPTPAGIVVRKPWVAEVGADGRTLLSATIVGEEPQQSEPEVARAPDPDAPLRAYKAATEAVRGKLPHGSSDVRFSKVTRDGPARVPEVLLLRNAAKWNDDTRSWFVDGHVWYLNGLQRWRTFHAEVGAAGDVFDLVITPAKPPPR